MKKTYLHILIIFLLGMMLSNSTFSQSNKLTSKNKKAVSAYNIGMNFFNQGRILKAEEQFLQAVRIDANFLEPRQMLGTLYEETGKPDQAIEQYEKVQQINPHFFPNNYFLLGNLYLKKGEYTSALKNFTSFVAVDGIKENLRARANELIIQAEFAQNLKNNPVPFKPQNLGPAINTVYGEYSHTLTADEEVLYFTKLRPRDQYTVCTTCKYEEDFYVSRKVNGQWTTAIPLGHPINTHGNEGAATISPDGMWFIYTACNRDDGYGSCDIYISKREGGKWSSPENMGPIINSTKWDSQPSIAPDGKTLYFTSAREGNMDIFVSVMDEEGQWQTPQNLGPVINTDKKEMAPFIHPDGKTLYFISDGHPGMGGLDIFYTRKQTDGSWSTPVNLGYPINTHNDESFFIVSASGKTAYYASDQLGGYGMFDLYSFEMPEELRPDPVYYLKGIITDKSTGKPIRAEFELFDIVSGQLIVKSYSDETEGSFLVCLPVNADYALNVNKKGFLFHSEHFQFAQPLDAKKPLEKNIQLHPIQVGEIVVMRNIFFDFDSDKLKMESIVELKKLIQLLKDNPLMHIEIRGHTDNVGSAQYNKALSERRAMSVFNYLIENGIRKERLKYKGFGDTMPIAPNDTDEGRALNRRTEFMVTKI